MLNSFGFDTKFCMWVKTILQFSMLSISINGKVAGYFSCKRGVRQGDPLSPLLFYLVEEVLSRGISKLVQYGSLQLMTGPRGRLVPSHVLYADDVRIFCKRTQQNLLRLNTLCRGLWSSCQSF